MDRALLIDDDLELCELIRRCARPEGIEVDACHTGREGLARLAGGGYSLVILDVMLPGMDGFEVLAQIRAESQLPILMFTARNDSAAKVRGLRAGADDYLTKPFEMEELLARMTFDGLVIDAEERTVATANGTFELPRKEFDVLLFLAQRQGKILTKQQIYEAVWQEPYGYDDNNIMAVISRLRKKLEPDPAAPKYIQTIKGAGYRSSREV